MRSGTSPQWRARPATHELTSLDERLGLLLVVRVGIVALVLLGAVFATDQVVFTASDVGPISAAYLLIAAGAEWYRRTEFPGRMMVTRFVLPIDALYLAIVCTPSGGPRSPLVVLFAVQLIAVTLLVSERAGIRMALWDSFLFICIPTLSLVGPDRRHARSQRSGLPAGRPDGARHHGFLGRRHLHRLLLLGQREGTTPFQERDGRPGRDGLGAGRGHGRRRDPVDPPEHARQRLPVPPGRPLVHARGPARSGCSCGPRMPT